MVPESAEASLKRKAIATCGNSLSHNKQHRSSFSSLPSDLFAADDLPTAASSPDIIDIGQPLYAFESCTVYPLPPELPADAPSASNIGVAAHAPTLPLVSSGLSEASWDGLGLKGNGKAEVIVLSSDDDVDSDKSGDSAFGPLGASIASAAPVDPSPSMQVKEVPTTTVTAEAEPGPSHPDLFACEHVVCPTEREKAWDLLKVYRKKFEELKEAGQSKPDMQACRLLKHLTPPDQHGHMPGWKVGDVFNGKGELCITGIHRNINGGIYYRKDKAWAIVLSGGYIDDDDNGLEFAYTGMGGRDPKSGHQVKDQTWASGNLGLQNAWKNNLPVRVARQTSKAPGAVRYVYDGIYRVAEAYIEKGKDGFNVCRFKMVGIPGHSRASHKVDFQPMANRFKNVTLVQSETKAKRADKKKVVEQLQGRKGKRCIVEDLSGGSEAVKIPVYNDIDDSTIMDNFTYVSRNEITDDAKEWIARGLEVGGHTGICGLARVSQQCVYAKGCLTHTDWCGVWECGSKCKKRTCQSNKVVSKGIKLPLEVFYTGTERGWGVRCSQNIWPGQFICEYLGEVVVDEEADRRTGDDEYLYALNHFTSVREEAMSECKDPHQLEDALAKLPDVPSMCYQEDNHIAHLVIDAKWKGNVARFINHSCAPNCEIQVVLIEGDSSMYFRVALFCGPSPIPAYTELSYDYKYKEGSVHGKVLYCKCGAPQCRKRLL